MTPTHQMQFISYRDYSNPELMEIELELLAYERIPYGFKATFKVEDDEEFLDLIFDGMSCFFPQPLTEGCKTYSIEEDWFDQMSVITKEHHKDGSITIMACL